ncbi:MAG: PAS domain S-box protein [Cycloclasticus sp.]
MTAELTQQLMQIVTSERNPVATLTLDGDISFVNSSALSAIDTKFEGVVGKKLWDCPWWDGDSSRQATVQQFFQQATSGETTLLNIQCVTQFGLRWLECCISAVRNEQGDITCFLIDGRDIESLKSAKTDLYKSEQRYKMLFENARHPVMLMNGNVILDCSDATATTLGYNSKHDIIGLHPADISPGKQSDGQDSRQKADDLIDVALQTGSNAFDWHHQRKNGEVFPAEVLITRIDTDEGPLIHGLWIDVSDRKLIEAKLADSELKYKTLFNNSVDAFSLVNDKERILDCNMAYVELFGYQKVEEIIGMCPLDLSALTQPDGRNSREVGHKWMKKIFNKGSLRFEWYGKGKNGKEFPIEIVSSTLIIDGETMLYSTLRDISDLKQSKQLLLASEKKYKTLFHDTVEASLLVDSKKQIVDCNQAAVELFGYSRRDDLLGRSPTELSPPTQPNGLPSVQEGLKLIEITIREGSQRFDWYHQRKNGQVFPVEVVSTVVVIDDEPILQTTLRDISRAKELEARLEGMAYYDALTNLPNRRLFVDRFSQAKAHAKRTKTKLAICFLDLDNFKPVNDEYGHEVGDKLLVMVAERIKDCIREEDTVSRQGGDEFNLLLTGIKSQTECEQSLQRVVQALQEPYLIDDVSHHISASIGAVIAQESDKDLDDLIRCADHAMYRAKASGRNRFQFYKANIPYREGI